MLLPHSRTLLGRRAQATRPCNWNFPSLNGSGSTVSDSPKGSSNPTKPHRSEIQRLFQESEGTKEEVLSHCTPPRERRGSAQVERGWNTSSTDRRAAGALRHSQSPSGVMPPLLLWLEPSGPCCSSRSPLVAAVLTQSRDPQPALLRCSAQHRPVPHHTPRLPLRGRGILGSPEGS